MENIKDNRSIQTSKAWEKLYSRLKAEELIPEQEVKAKNKSVYYGLRIAAVALVLLVTAVLVLVSIDRTPPAAGLVKLTTVNEGITLVKTLSDGSVIYIAQNSLFCFPEKFKPASRNVELKGEAFFDIAPNPSKPFIVETDEAYIQVLGTAFNVKTQNGNGFELSVDRGKVKVTLKKDATHGKMVIAGEKIAAVNNSLVTSKYIACESGSWYTKRMHFKDEKLSDIITVLNRNFSTNFVLADEETGKHKLTVTFQNETAATMTELICTALNLKSHTINGSVVFSETGKGSKRD